MSTPYHALVIGASGLIGWAVVDQLLRSYPSHDTFPNITALVNRPLSLEQSFWSIDSAGPALNLVSGVNLQCEDEAVFEKMLREKVPEISTVSHVFYFAFKPDSSPSKEVSTNLSMLRLLLRTLQKTSPSLKFLVYPGGTRGYGIYTPGGIFSAPLHESLADSLPEDYKATVCYPHYRTLLNQESKNKDWKWCELCPDAIIGFTPNGSGFSLAGHWATYLCTYKLVSGEGAEIPFPGTWKGYDALFTETSAENLARVAIHAGIHPDTFSGKIFNVADTATPGTMRERWPQITKWFGLKGVPPEVEAKTTDLKPSEFVKKHLDRLEAAKLKGIEIGHEAQLDSYGYWLTFDRHLSLERLRDAGFEEERNPQESWWKAFDMFKRAGMIL